MCLGMTDERSLSTHFIHNHHSLFPRACRQAGSATQRSRNYGELLFTNTVPKAMREAGTRALTGGDNGLLGELAVRL